MNEICSLGVEVLESSELGFFISWMRLENNILALVAGGVVF
jgi:hypothetical protein